MKEIKVFLSPIFSRTNMKRTRNDQEIVRLLERVASLEMIPKDVLHHILLTSGLNVRDINGLCNRCKSEELWEKIYLKYVVNSNVASWRASVAVRQKQKLLSCMIGDTLDHISECQKDIKRNGNANI